VTLKFPITLIESYAQFLFLPLVLRLVNDSSALCRKLAASTIGALITRLGEPKVTELIHIAHQWFKSEQKTLRRAAIQISGIFVQYLRGKYQKFALSTLIQINQALHLQTGFEKDDNPKQEKKRKQQDAEDGDNNSERLESIGSIDWEQLGWELIYYSLSTFSKLTAQFPVLLRSKEGVLFTMACVYWLIHPHHWVRLAASRCLGTYFAEIDASTLHPVQKQNPKQKQNNQNKRKADQQNDDGLSLFSQKDIIQLIFHHLCMQLTGEVLDDELGTQIIKNLFFITKCLHLHPHLNIPRTQEGAESEEELEEEGEAAEQDPDATAGSTFNVGESPFVEKKGPLTWLFKRLSRIARFEGGKNKTFSQRNNIFKWYAVVGNYLQKEELEKYLVHILSPLFRVVHGPTLKNLEFNKLKKLAGEIMKLLQKIVGTTQYFQAYNHVRMSIQNIRQERKQKKVLEAVTNPEKAALRKLQKNAMKKQSRKRKIEQYQSEKPWKQVKKARISVHNPLFETQKD